MYARAATSIHPKVWRKLDSRRSDELEPPNVEDRCQHGKEIRYMWRRPHGEQWQILGQPKCAECPGVISLAIVSEKPAGIADYEG